MRDCVVVGAGHAGVEAALSLAHAGKDIVLVTIKLDHIAKMPCNPSVGGPAKGIVVREIDALGGMMPKIADKTALQLKMLNTTKGPGVWSMRVQSDKLEYSKTMKEICLNTENLTVIEDIVEEVIVEDIPNIPFKDCFNFHRRIICISKFHQLLKSLRNSFIDSFLDLFLCCKS